jgi:hypothetical protein
VTIRERQVVGAVRHAYASLFIARKPPTFTFRTSSFRQIADASQIKYAAGRRSQQDTFWVAELSGCTTTFCCSRQANVAAARSMRWWTARRKRYRSPIEPSEQALLPHRPTAPRDHRQPEPDARSKSSARMRHSSAKRENKPISPSRLPGC